MNHDEGAKLVDSNIVTSTANGSDSALLLCYPTYFVKGKGLEGMTAQTLACELDIDVDRVETALSNLIDKGLVRAIRTGDKKYDI